MRIRPAILSICVLPLLVAAHSAEHLKPSSKWVVDYATGYCRLGRTFGEGKDRITLLMDQFEPGDSFLVEVRGPGIHGVKTQRLQEVEFGFNAGPVQSGKTALHGQTVTGEEVLHLLGEQRIVPLTPDEKAEREAAREANRPFDVPPQPASRLASATEMKLGNVMKRDVILETGPMDVPMAALQKCTWDLVDSWGFDVDQQRNLSRKPIADTPVWKLFSGDDYPDKMLSRGFQGVVTYKLMIDAAGKPTRCEVIESTGPKDFDSVVCAKVMSGAHFQPALDANGKPVASFSVSTITFRLK